MPKFFFDFFDGGCERGADRDGLDLDDEECVKREATQAVLQVLQLEQSADGHRRVECKVRDGVGKEVYTVSLTFTATWANDEVGLSKIQSVQKNKQKR